MLSRISDLHQLPDWAAAMIWVSVSVSLFVGAYSMVRVVSYLTHRDPPPPPCGSMGVYQTKVVYNDGVYSIGVVCKNGRVHWE